MIQITYPKDIEKFKEDYKRKFNFNGDSWNKLIQDMDCYTKRVFKTHKIKSFDDLVIASFDILLEIYNAFPKKKNKKKVKSKYENFYEKLFEYDGTNQKNISKFFMKYSKELKLKTCYFCNIDFINTINFDVLDILKEGTQKELEALDGIGKDKAKEIISHRKENPINSIEDISSTTPTK